MHILVVENELKILNFLKKGFEEQSFCVDATPDGLDGLFLAKQGTYDCIVLDIALPSLSGYDIAKRLRYENNTTPIIFLTAKDAVQDRLKGFELGGDDYLIKPFAFSELLARVKALIRRNNPLKPLQFQIGNLHIDIAKRLVTKNKVEIDLTPKEFSLLHYFIEHQGEIITRTMLSEHVWGYHFDSMTNVIDVHITNLRKKIEDSDSPSLIKTLRGVGYRLDATE